MNYRETIDYLFSSLPMYQRTGKAAYKANLDNTIALDTILGHPHQNFKTIHVAGTNGKGSVCHMLTSILMEAGYKTGLYTSPHLIDFRERIRINGKMIEEKQVVEFVKSLKDEIEEIKPSFFEMTAAMAFDLFANENVDVAVIETGMGGRLDSTNIITPEISIITSISMDHMEFLGPTEAHIAYEKAGIIKENIPCLSGLNSRTTNSVLESVAKKNNSSIYYPEQTREFKYQTFSIANSALYHFYNKLIGKDEMIQSDLSGSYQNENINITLLAIDILRERSWKIPQAAIHEGFKKVVENTQLRGRWENIAFNPRVICDTAHNEEGIQAVMGQLNMLATKKLHIVWGMVGDKSPERILPLLPKDATYYFTQAEIPRAMEVEDLKIIASNYNLKGEMYKHVKEAFKAAKSKAVAEDTIFIGGSTFVVADLLLFLQK